MKKTLLSAMLLLVATGATAQEKQFEEALQKGRSAGKFYLMDNTGGKALKAAKVEEYVKAKGYLTGQSTLTKNNSIMQTLYFLPKEEYSDYVYECLCMSQDEMPNKLTQQGEGILFSASNNGTDYFRKVGNILWSGDVTGGKLNGTGIGFAQLDIYNRPQNTDQTKRVSTLQKDWHAGGYTDTQYAPAVSTDDGRTGQKMCETYVENTSRTGELMYQTITGLENGEYVVELYASALYTPGRGFSSNVQEGAKDVVYISANGNRKYLPILRGTALKRNALNFIQTRVTDGTLRISMTAEKPGTNWHVIQIKSLQRKGGKILYADNNSAATHQPNYQNDQLFVLIKGTFKDGVPQGEVAYTYYDNLGKMDTSSSDTPATEKTIVGTFSDGMASFQNGNLYGFVNQQGNAVIAPQYPSIVSDFTADKAAVTTDEGQEVWIDKTGKVLGPTDRQKKLLAEAEKKRQAEERQARLLAEQERVKAEKVAEQKRLEEERAEKARLEAAKKDLALKRNSVGKRITWHETISYDTSGGGFGGLLLGAVGLGSTDYDIEYTAIVESILGDSSVKCVVSNARICSPGLASANWIKYKGVATEDMMKAVGQTRVKDFSEFKLAK